MCASESEQKLNHARRRKEWNGSDGSMVRTLAITEKCSSCSQQPESNSAERSSGSSLRSQSRLGPLNIHEARSRFGMGPPGGVEEFKHRGEITEHLAGNQETAF